MKQKSFMNWSGGKDSALALYKARQAGVAVELLVTSVNKGTDRISMHGVRRELLNLQAISIGLPLRTIELPEMPGMQLYEDAVRLVHQQLAMDGFTNGIFGDIFLEDLKQYRETLLAEDNLECLFPLWKKNTSQLMHEFLAAGFKAVVVCVNAACMDVSFCGRMLDESFLSDLPGNVDMCGENGEYHSFVFDGPGFNNPIPFIKGEIVSREYAAPTPIAATNGSDDCFSTPQARSGFYFRDLITV